MTYLNVCQDMDLLDDTRTLIHTGKLLRSPETGFDITGGGWTELFVLLFDNYRGWSVVLQLEVHAYIFFSCDDKG